MSEENELPWGWCWTTLGDLGDWSGGGTPSKAREEFWTGGDIPWVSPKDMKTLLITDTEDHLSTQALEETALKLCSIGTILIVVRSGILQRILPVAVCQVPVTMNQDMKALSPKEGISSMYVVYYLMSSAYEILSSCSKNGTTVASIESDALKAYPIPLSSTTEQHRIVAAIEQQFTRLDAAVAAIQHTKAKLKRYRASVLKAAVEGKLTEAWRAEHPATEPANVLLERILVERRAKWEAELRAKGKDPAKVKYVEPAMPDVENLPELPEGWCWATFEQVSQRVTVGFVGSMKDEYIDNGIPFLRGQNVRPNYFDPTSLKFISREFHEQLAKSALEYLDILVVRSGSVGTACVMPDTYNEANCSDLVIVKQPIHVNSYYAAYYMNSTAQDRVKAKQVGIALTHFNTQSMAAMPLPLPPLLEQQQIVVEVERRLSIVTQVEATVNANLKRAERLRQSILKEAFAGRLVPQDPNDEPASVLLERIHKEREGQKQGPIKKTRAIKTISAPRMPDVEPMQIDASEMEQMDLWASIGSRE